MISYSWKVLFVHCQNATKGHTVLCAVSCAENVKVNKLATLSMENAKVGANLVSMAICVKCVCTNIIFLLSTLVNTHKATPNEHTHFNGYLIYNF